MPELVSPRSASSKIEAIYTIMNGKIIAICLACLIGVGELHAHHSEHPEPESVRPGPPSPGTMAVQTTST